MSPMNMGDFREGASTVKILVAGDEIEVQKSDAVYPTLKRILEEKGIDSFTIIVDGVEVTETSTLPATFEGHEVEVQRYTKPGA